MGEMWVKDQVAVWGVGGEEALSSRKLMILQIFWKGPESLVWKNLILANSPGTESSKQKTELNQ